MMGKIMEVFGIIITEYGNCALCAIQQVRGYHRNPRIDILLKDHNVQQSVWAELDNELGISKNGSCHGCGLSLLMLNTIPEHIPSRTCIYYMLVRLICYDIFMTGKISSCLTNMEPGFLDTRDIKSFSRWLKLGPLGESVNNLTRILYNWTAHDHVIPRRLNALTPTVQVVREKKKSTDGVMGNSRGNDAAAVEIHWPAETLRGGRKREGSNTLPTDFGQTESRRHHDDSPGGLGF
ncbi:hypothetical protein V1506DRAFT_550393, partial [Lipomyces tetrasporus]